MANQREEDVNKMDFDAYKRTPDFVNEEGVKWWKSGTWRGRTIFHVELKDGERIIVALDKDGTLIKESHNYEDVAVAIDILAIANGEDLTNA